MTTPRLMLVHRAAPLSSAQVRLLSESGTSELVTDEAGQLTLAADAKTLTVEVEVEGRRLSRKIVLRPGELTVLDMDAAPDDLMSAVTGSFERFQGQLLGDRYRFEKLLGRGGMGIVLRAQDELLHRQVAIKMLNEELSEHPEAQKIFMAEARSLAALRHPNLVGIYDVTMLDGRALIVFEYVEGVNLEDILAERGPLTEADTVALGAQLASAFAYLHEQGIVHRDIKPANLLVQPDGVVKIIDFGLARSLAEMQARGTQVRGTPAYMAPEQLLGDPITPAVDMYQFGVSLYELLTADLPFSATANMALAHVNLPPRALSGLRPGVDLELEAIIHDCLAKAPEARPDALTLRERLDVLADKHEARYAKQREIASWLPARAAHGATGRVTPPRALADTDIAPPPPIERPASVISGRPATAAVPHTIDPADDSYEARAAQPRASLPRHVAIMIATLCVMILGASSLVLALMIGRAAPDAPAPEQAALIAPPPDAEPLQALEPQAPALPEVAPEATPPEVAPQGDVTPQDELAQQEDVAPAPEIAPDRPSVKVTRAVEPKPAPAKPKEQAQTAPPGEADALPRDLALTPPAPAPPAAFKAPASPPTAPAGAVEEEPEASSEPATTQQVIRKRIIRKVVPKTPAVSPPPAF